MKLLRLHLTVPARIELVDQAGRDSSVMLTHVDAGHYVVERSPEGYVINHPSSEVCTFVPLSSVGWVQWELLEAGPAKKPAKK